ncbi:PhzF family phenazine biosynthesis protein [Planococcus lenghuensis]|uniref:Phenazine biosynthesis protein PhzF n=1 Tax=Planococcus lenghuensis TaxID=2213202 RepID=A0A1Q2KW23_9BACL|nr:PhzF family phenazine biosynthesis protein [Planococcus lenghuensis]AQQ52400.1 phenazine biosynthesis protein PhzF [Planococcus lenghuensis]
MPILPYTLIDVFTDQPFGGNQLAVFQPEAELPKELMQKIARELNLSETVFLYPAANQENTRKLRIFTPKMELPMAGHPTIGAAFVLADTAPGLPHTGMVSWMFEEQVGVLSVTVHRKDGGTIRTEMKQPVPGFEEPFQDRQLAAHLLSVTEEDLHESRPVQTVSSGVPFLYIPLRSLDAVKRISFRLDVWEQQFSGLDIFAFATETVHSDSSVHSRMFAPAMGIPEDPATGAASGPLGAYLTRHGIIPFNDMGIARIRSEQGIELGRPSFIDITIAKSGNGIKEVTIGGQSVVIGKGEIYIKG